MKIFVKDDEKGGKGIRLFIPLFLAANRITFNIIWEGAKTKIDKRLPLEKRELYIIFKKLLKDLKNYKGLELVNVSKKGKKIVSIIV